MSSDNKTEFCRIYTTEGKWIYTRNVVPESFGRYIELIDDKGNKYSPEIFTGDIIKYRNPHFDKDFIGVVKVVNGCAHVVGNNASPNLYDVIFENNGVVIGNITENPDLLQEGGEK